MSPEEFENLSGKVKGGSATEEEMLLFFKELNNAVIHLREGFHSVTNKTTE